MMIDIRALINLEEMLRIRGYNTSALASIVGQYKTSEEVAAYFRYVLGNYETIEQARQQSDFYSMSHPGQPYFLRHKSQFKNADDKLNLAYSFRVFNGTHVTTVLFADAEIGWVEFFNSLVNDDQQAMLTGNLGNIRMRYIFISLASLTSQAKAKLRPVIKILLRQDPISFQEFDIDELIINPLDCEMGSQYKVFSREETEAWLLENTLSAGKMPRIEMTDAPIKYLGVAPGVIVECRRTANIPGHIVNDIDFFRLVVLAPTKSLKA